MAKAVKNYLSKREAILGSVIIPCEYCGNTVQGFPRKLRWRIISNSTEYGYAEVHYIQCKECNRTIFLD